MSGDERCKRVSPGGGRRLGSVMASGLVSGALAAACGPDLTSIEGEHITYKVSPGLELCAGTVGYVDGYVPFVAGQLGITVSRQRIYEWLGPDDLNASKCSEPSACAYARRAISWHPWHLHEVAHTAVYGTGLNTWPFFSEGIATAYDYMEWYAVYRVLLVPPGTPRSVLDPRPFFLEDRDGVGPAYALAAMFVSFLIARHGPERFVEFAGGLTLPKTERKLYRRFRRIYGVDLDDEVEAWLAEAPCEEDDYAVLPYDCAMPEVGWTQGTWDWPPFSGEEYWEYHKVIDCASDDVAGGIAEDRVFSSIHGVTLEVTRPGTYALFLENPDEVAIQLGRCFGCMWEHQDVLAYTSTTQQVTLERGRYFLRMIGDSDRSPEVGVWLYPLNVE